MPNDTTYTRPRSYSRYSYYGASSIPVQPRAQDCVPWKLANPDSSPACTCALCGAASDKPLVELPVNVLLQVTDNLYPPGCNADRPSYWEGGDTVDLEAETLDVCAACLDSMDLHPCVECSDWILPNQDHTTLNQRRGVQEYIHDSCLDESDWFKCADCNEWTEERRRYRRSNCDNDEVCESCGEHYYGCDSCGGTVHEDDTRSCGDATLCESCFDAHYTYCHHCGEAFEQSNTREYRGDDYCTDCYSDLDICQCARCGNEIETGEGFDSGDGDCYCARCARCARPLSGPTDTIHAYELKPQPTFHGEEPQTGRAPLYLGVELEIHAEDRDSAVEKIGEQMNQDHLYLKHDGSLDRYKGVELVSQPCTLDYHRSSFGWDALLATLRANSCTSHDARKGDVPCCGLHVHVSRAYFNSSLEECKFGVFFYTHFRDGETGPVNTLARRNPGTYCHSDSYRKTYCERGNPQQDHYDAVNYSNVNTIEVRCARGTLKEVSFYAWLELCDAVARWVHTVSITVCSAVESWATFAAWVALPENQDRYAHLIAYMKEREV